MAARQKYPTTHAQLFELAQAARREGLEFDAFWERAIRPGRPPVTWRTEVKPYGAVIWPNDTDDRKLSRGATMDPDVEAAWGRAYDRLPATRQEAALKILSPMLDALEADREAEIREAIAA